MTLMTERRTRSEQIGDILTALEHTWKMQPTLSFTEVLQQVSPRDYNTMDDDGFERDLRLNLKAIMQGSRDRT